MQDEESLVRKAKEGDKQAFARLYEGHFDRIYRYLALKTGDKAEAEDMTQQVFINALQSFSTFHWKGTPVSAWFFRIAHNLVVDHYRKKSKLQAVPLDESLARGDHDPQSLAELSWDIEQVASAMHRLTAAQQEVLSLRFAGGLSIAETAQAMGKSEGAIKALQHSAVAALRRVLSVGKQ